MNQFIIHKDIKKYQLLFVMNFTDHTYAIKTIELLPIITVVNDYLNVIRCQLEICFKFLVYVEMSSLLFGKCQIAA